MERFIALLVLVALVVLGGCAAEPVSVMACVPGESRACSCPSGAIGAQVCNDLGERLGPCECEVVISDAGTSLDASSGPDAGVRADDAGLLDGGPRDGGPTDAGPPDSSPTWACDIITQTGCPSGHVCRLAHVGGRSPANGPPTCVPRNYSTDFVAEHRTCATRVDDGTIRTDNCAPALFCHNFTCKRYCDPERPACPEVDGSPYTCVVAGSVIDPNPAGYGVCTYVR